MIQKIAQRHSQSVAHGKAVDFFGEDTVVTGLFDVFENGLHQRAFLVGLDGVLVPQQIRHRFAMSVFVRNVGFLGGDVAVDYVAVFSLKMKEDQKRPAKLVLVLNLQSNLDERV